MKRMNQLVPALFSFAALAAALAGCGGSAAPPAASAGTTQAPVTQTRVTAAQINDLGLNPPGRKPCEFMLRADAEVALGRALPNTTELIPLGMCDYTTAEFYGASLTVGDWESIKGAATAGKKLPDTISGVGDEALNLNGSNGSILYVRKGARGFLLTINGPGIDGSPGHGLEREKVLALKILPNL
jgi:hypothetical protein